MTEQGLDKALISLKEDIYDNMTDGIETRIESLFQQCVELGNGNLVGRALFCKASFLRRIGNFDDSIRVFKEAFKYFLLNHNSQLQVSLLNELGTTYLDIGQDDEAMECFFRGLDILNREKTYDVTRASIANNLGTAYYDLEDYAKAQKYFKEAYELLTVEHSTKMLPIVTFNLAQTYYYLDDVSQSKKYTQISKSISTDAQDHIGIAFSNAMEEIIAYDVSKDLDQLLKAYESCSQWMSQQGDLSSLLEIDHMFCQALYRHEEWTSLKPLLEKLYVKVLDAEIISRINNIRHMLKKLYLAQGDYESAYGILENESNAKTTKIKKLENQKYRQVDKDYKQINNEHYVNRLEDSVRIFKLLSEVGNGITLNKDFKGIFDYIVDHIYSIWELDVFGVAIIDEEDDSINYFYNTIEDGNRVGKRSRRNKSVLMNYCINNNTEIFINDATVDVEYRNKYSKEVYEGVKNSSEKSLIFSPMIIGDKVIGGLTVQSTHPDYFNSGALEVVRTFAAYCSTAIANHNRHMKLQKMKDIDGLTGAYNRHALINFNNQFDEEPEQKSLPLFIAMLDIDYFKQYNDNYGHIAGDECIVKVVQIIDEVVRKYGGKLFRYGGDEFNIIVEACNEHQAKEILEMILDKLKAVSLRHEFSKVSGQVTLSIGGIVIDGLDKYSKAYYQEVDQLLYEVKRRGRNGYEIKTI